MSTSISIIRGGTKKQEAERARNGSLELPGTVIRHSDDFKIEENFEVT